MSTPDNSFIKYSPYVRLTKNSSGNYTLWVVTFIPQNFTIPKDPTVDASNPKLVQVNVYVESNGDVAAAKWEATSLKIALPTPENAPVSNATINVTVWLDDPEDEGSVKTNYEEAEEE